jgi:hypothetical protein
MNKDYDRILKEAKELQKKYKNFNDKSFMKDATREEFNSAMEKEYSYLKNEIEIIFSQALNGTLDLTVFTYMISKAKDVKKHKITNHDADVEVGQKLVDTFIKPHLDKSKGKSK